MAEVMALGPDDTRGRLGEMEKLMVPAWRRVFDDQLRGVARKLSSGPTTATCSSRASSPTTS